MDLFFNLKVHATASNPRQWLQCPPTCLITCCKDPWRNVQAVSHPSCIPPTNDTLTQHVSYTACIITACVIYSRYPPPPFPCPPHPFQDQVSPTVTAPPPPTPPYPTPPCSHALPTQSAAAEAASDGKRLITPLPHLPAPSNHNTLTACHVPRPPPYPVCMCSIT